MRARALVFVGFATFAVAFGGACDRAPTDEGLREWAPADHDRKEETERLKAGVQASAQAKPSGSAPQKPGDENRALVEITWRQQCLQCHGMIGHGDGPNGPMVKAPDLTREDFQEKATDAEIAATIKSGRKLMPKFDLPEPVLVGIVARIRASRGH